MCSFFVHCDNLKINFGRQLCFFFLCMSLPKISFITKSHSNKITNLYIQLQTGVALLKPTKENCSKI